MKSLAFLLFLSSPVLAASPDICRPYAAQTVQSIMKYTWSRVYHSCLNADATPVPLSTWEEVMCMILPNCQFAMPGSVPAVDLADPKKKVYRKRRKHRH